MATFTRWISRSLPFKRISLFVNTPLKKNPPIAYMHCSKILFDSYGQEIKMPSLSPTMTEGTIIRWLKKEGDTISPGDILCEIQTDKAIVGFEVEDDGILAKIVVPDDSKDIKIGTVIGVMVDSGEDWRSVKLPSSDQPSGSKNEKPSVLGIEIKMPSLSPTMVEGTIIKWLKKEGESFSPGDALCEIQTDKAIVAFEVEEEGILAKILIPENSQNVQLGTVIALMVNEGEDWENVIITSSNERKGTSQSLPNTDEVKLQVSHEKDKKQLRLFGPSVRNLLHEYGIEYSLITATGPHSVLLKGDVLNYINKKSLQPKHDEQKMPKVPDVTFLAENIYIDIPNSSMRQTIAKRLTQSKTTIPHAYMSIDCIVDEVVKLRNTLKSQDVIVSINDFIIKCAAEALVKVPEVNVINSDGVKKMSSIDVSIAVATDKGLITPIIKHTNALGVQQISESVKHLATKARAGRLKPDEYQGGSFSISNLGMFGISEFCAVINPPQGAILAIGTSRILFQENKIVTKMTVTLSFDTRLILDTDAAKFLQCFRDIIENPFSNILCASSDNLKNSPR